MEIIFATGNQHKVVEAQKALGDSFTLIMPKELGLTEEIPEDGDTLVKNAVQKAGKDGIVACLGSLYFSGEIRQAYLNLTGGKNE